MQDATFLSKSAYQVMKKASNCNRLPKNKLLWRMVLISLWIAPLVSWFLWLD